MIRFSNVFLKILPIRLVKTLLSLTGKTAYSRMRWALAKLCRVFLCCVNLRYVIIIINIKKVCS